MFSAMRLDYVACIKPKVLACGVRTKGPILGAGALALTLFSGSAAQAQCTVSGLTDLSKVAGGVVANAGVMAVTNVSAWGMQHSALSAVALGSTRLSLVARPAGASIAY